MRREHDRTRTCRPFACPRTSRNTRSPRIVRPFQSSMRPFGSGSGNPARTSSNRIAVSRAEKTAGRMSPRASFKARAPRRPICIVSPSSISASDASGRGNPSSRSPAATRSSTASRPPSPIHAATGATTRSPPRFLTSTRLAVVWPTTLRLRGARPPSSAMTWRRMSRSIASGSGMPAERRGRRPAERVLRRHPSRVRASSFQGRSRGSPEYSDSAVRRDQVRRAESVLGHVERARLGRRERSPRDRIGQRRRHPHDHGWRLRPTRAPSTLPRRFRAFRGCRGGVVSGRQVRRRECIPRIWRPFVNHAAGGRGWEGGGRAGGR